MKIMGLDFGEKRMGVAISDPGGKLARPLVTLTRPKERPWLDLLEPLIRQHGPDEIVIGYPRRLDGSPGTLAAAVEELARGLGRISGVSVVLRDESLTTIEAAAKLAESGMRRRARRKKIDTAAAAVILQDYLDSRPKPGAER